MTHAKNIAQMAIDLNLHNADLKVNLYEQQKPRSVKLHSNNRCSARALLTKLSYEELIKREKQLCSDCTYWTGALFIKDSWHTTKSSMPKSTFDAILKFLQLIDALEKAEKTTPAEKTQNKQIKINAAKRALGELEYNLNKIVQNTKVQDLHYTLSQRVKKLVEEDNNNAKSEKQQILDQLKQKYGIVGQQVDETLVLLGIDNYDQKAATILTTRLIACLGIQNTTSKNNPAATQKGTLLKLPRWAADWIMQKKPMREESQILHRWTKRHRHNRNVRNQCSIMEFGRKRQTAQ